MNNQNPQMFIPFPQNNGCQCSNELRNVNSQINNINQELRRLERRILNLEKSLVPTPFNSNINPPPMSSNNFDYTSDNYSNENYMI